MKKEKLHTMLTIIFEQYVNPLDSNMSVELRTKYGHILL